MNKFVKFWHELFNPHCAHCVQMKREEMEQKELDREIALVCAGCEIAKIELAKAHELINKLTTPKEESKLVETTEQPRILNRNTHIPFSVMRQKLERESREEARRIREKALESAAKPDDKIEKLETELGITNAGNTTTIVAS